MTATPFTPGAEGVFYDLPDRTYREAPGISNSMLKHVSSTGEEPGSPAHFQVYLKDPTRLTRPLLLGRLAHAAILRPEDPLETIVVQPEERAAQADDSVVKQKKVAVGDMIPWHNASKVCKAWNQVQAEVGNTVVTKKEYETLVGVVKSIAAHPEASRALKEGAAEVSVFGEFWREFDGRKRMILRKARMDWVSKGSSLVDLKTTTDARPEAFGKAMYSLRYYVQASYYLDLWNAANPDDQKTNFVFIAVEKFPPFAVNVFDVHPNALRAGREQYERDLNILMTCYETETWPAYDPTISGLDIPAYAYKKGPGVFI